MLDDLAKSKVDQGNLSDTIESDSSKCGKNGPRVYYGVVCQGGRSLPWSRGAYKVPGFLRLFTKTLD